MGMYAYSGKVGITSTTVSYIRSGVQAVELMAAYRSGAHVAQITRRGCAAIATTPARATPSVWGFVLAVSSGRRTPTVRSHTLFKKEDVGDILTG